MKSGSNKKDGNMEWGKTNSEYLTLYPVSGIRLNAGILVLFFLNLFLVIPVLGVPYQPIFAYILLPPLAVMNIWAFALIAAPRKLQLNYVLFRGVFGIVSSLGFVIVTQKFAYAGLDFKTPMYAIGSFAAYGFALYHYIKSHLRKLKSPGKMKKQERSIPRVSIAVLTGVGYLAANLSLMFVTEEVVTIVLMCVYSMLTFVMFHFIWELHRYYWLNRRTAGTKKPPISADLQ
ncbi:hypothetical protein J45TS6_24710 [Paenibacillus sp. J45TS6]|uniref:hypothetical protein n=1 Tax=Paenibacillus sp. J45TS6 TaxID=2807196 RepID=UPI001B18F0A5|nr:hypothetical protein [Paenibacillus sp. J45TS6]GIP44012.1 hypothetical protein J45TS6_24710 [Paenibacillus sp. J45TS6]